MAGSPPGSRVDIPMKKPKPPVLVAIAWLVFVLLAVAIFNVGDRLQQRWHAQPPTETEMTDCRIESMMGGDNPVEVERINRECLQAANEAYVAPRVSRFRIFSALLLLVSFLAALGTTWQVLGNAARAGAGGSR